MNDFFEVYEFGSFFNGADEARDIDLILIHSSLSKSSCEFAILCKTLMKRALPMAHITMMSAPEQEGVQFVERAKAKPLGTIYTNTVEIDVAGTCTLIASRHPAQFERLLAMTI